MSVLYHDKQNEYEKTNTICPKKMIRCFTVPAQNMVHNKIR